MNRKILVIVGIIGIIIGLFVVINLLTKDEVKSELAAVLENNTQIVELGNIAASRFGDSEVKQTAVNLATVTLSDNRNLTAYWQKRHGKKLPQNHKDFKKKLNASLTELKEISHGPTFDSRWLEIINELLKKNTVNLKSVYNGTGNTELRSLSEATFNNQSLFLKQLEGN